MNNCVSACSTYSRYQALFYPLAARFRVSDTELVYVLPCAFLRYTLVEKNQFHYLELVALSSFVLRQPRHGPRF